MTTEVIVANMPRFNKYTSPAQREENSLMARQVLLDQFACAFLASTADSRDATINRLRHAYSQAEQAMEFRDALLKPSLDKIWSFPR